MLSNIEGKKIGKKSTDTNKKPTAQPWHEFIRTKQNAEYYKPRCDKMVSVCEPVIELLKLKIQQLKDNAVNLQKKMIIINMILVSKSILNYINNSLFYLSYEFLRSFN